MKAAKCLDAPAHRRFQWTINAMAETRLNPEHILPSHCELQNVLGYLVKKSTVRVDDENVIAAI
jgi:hypothetical protein